MAITRTPIHDDDGSGHTGTIIDNAWKQEFYNQIDALAGATGDWIDVPFSAANFTASGGGVWTVGQFNYAYAKVGAKTALLSLYLGPGTLTGNPTQLFITLPFAVVVNYTGVCTYYASGLIGAGTVLTANGNQLMLLRDVGGSPWGTAGVYIVLSMPVRLS